MNNETLRQAREIENALRSKGGLGKQILTGMIASLIWTVLVTTLVVAAALFGSDILDAWSAVTGRSS